MGNKEDRLAANAAKVTQFLARPVAVGNAPHEIGKGAPNTGLMQGTTNEIVPDRTLSYDR